MNIFKVIGPLYEFFTFRCWNSFLLFKVAVGNSNLVVAWCTAGLRLKIRKMF